MAIESKDAGGKVMTGQVRCAPPGRTWLTLLHDLGVRPGNVLRAAKLPEDLLVRSETISVEAFVRFWRALEEQVEEPALPVFLAERVTTEGLAPPLFAALCSGDLATAMERLTQYKTIMGPGGYALSRSRDGSLRIQAKPPKEQGALPQSLLVTELAVALQVARIGTRERISPKKVVVRERLDAPHEYARFFGVQPDVGRENTLVVGRDDAARPFITDNPEMWRTFEPSLRARLSEFTDVATADTRVRAALLELLPSGRSTVDVVASKLGLSRRSLQRQLSSEGTTFKDVLARTRSDLAHHYLQRTDLSLSEISYLLAFNDPRSFFRAFRSWTGTSPERFRSR